MRRSGSVAPRAVLRPAEGGARIARYMVAVAGRAPGLELEERSVNGVAGLVAPACGRRHDGGLVRGRRRPGHPDLGGPQSPEAAVVGVRRLPSADGEGVRGCDDVPVNFFSYSSIGPGHDGRHLPEPRRAEPGRWPVLEAALAAVNRDLLAAMPGREALVLFVVPSASGQPVPPGGADSDQVYVAMPDGRWHGNQVNACDPEEGDPSEPDDATTVLTVVADAAQSTVMELLRQVWPVCPEHRIGMHPRPAGTTDGWYEGATDAAGPPVWWCRGGRDSVCHDVALVGELADALPGARRRALRRSERRRGAHR